MTSYFIEETKDFCVLSDLKRQISETGICRFFRYIPSDGKKMDEPQTGGKTVFRNKICSPWELRPRQITKGETKQSFPENRPRPLVNGLFRRLWRILLKFNQVPRLTFQERTERFKGSPGHHLTAT